MPVLQDLNHVDHFERSPCHLSTSLASVRTTSINVVQRAATVAAWTIVPPRN
jgi:hypothetical protein